MRQPMVDRVEWSYHDDPLESAAAMVGQLARLEADQYDYLAHYLTDCADDPGLSTIDGGERRFAYGGAGTPAVPEFAVTQVQVSLRLSPWAAQKLVADVMSLTYRCRGCRRPYARARQRHGGAAWSPAPPATCRSRCCSRSRTSCSRAAAQAIH